MAGLLLTDALQLCDNHPIASMDASLNRASSELAELSRGEEDKTPLIAERRFNLRCDSRTRQYSPVSPMAGSRAEPVEVPASLVKGLLSQDRIDQAPHNFYKYPARFSPQFAAEAVRAYSDKGDTVLDPFCGGGTTLIEAVSAGRRAIGFDISELAVFISQTKAYPLTVHDRYALHAFIRLVASGSASTVDVEAQPEIRNLPNSLTGAFAEILQSISLLKRKRQNAFARLALLETGRWAVETCRTPPSAQSVRNHFCQRLSFIVKEQGEFLRRIKSNLPGSVRPSTMLRVLNTSSESGADDRRVPGRWKPAKLVLTSPPYPGVHMLYHRWQLQGRKETPAPFWLTNTQDGAGESYYTLGSRKEPKLKQYFVRLRDTYSSLLPIITSESLVLQLVAFSQPDWQLPAFLQAMGDAGFVERRPVCDPLYLTDNRLWRNVPGRKWYTTRNQVDGAHNELLLIHSPK